MPSTIKKSVKVKAKKTKKKKKQQFPRWILPLVFFLIGINLIVLGGVYLLYRRTILSFHVSPSITAEMHLRTALPKTITISSVGIDIPIDAADIENGIWKTSETHATYLNSSGRPGEGNNIVIYGHNRKNIFAPLKKVHVGDVIAIHNAEGKTYEYKVTEITTVKPTEIEKVLPTDHEVLTVYTCTGFLDSLRLIVIAQPFRVFNSL